MVLIAVAAHTDPQVLETLAGVLEEVGWTVHATDVADEAVAACRRLEADANRFGAA